MNDKLLEISPFILKHQDDLSFPASLPVSEKEPLMIVSQKIHQMGIDELKRIQETEVISLHSMDAKEMAEGKLLAEGNQRAREVEQLLEKNNQNPLVEKIGESLTAEEIQFFTYHEPVEWFPLSFDNKGRIKFDIPSDKANVKKLIYIFKNKEKERFLIGKTGTSFKGRMSKYATWFNKTGNDSHIKKEGRKAFLNDIRQNPSHLEVGILYALQPDEDLDLFETLFIDCKRKVYDLYNDHRGGGGGLAHAEEVPTIYAIPKPDTAVFTPEKYYPYKRDANGNIRPEWTPGVKDRIQRLKDKMEDTQEFTYAVKRMDTQERYIGITGDFQRRSKEHGYAAEYCDPDHEKYDPERVSGPLYSEMAENPELFGAGLLPVQSAKSVEEENLKDYVLISTIGKVEKYSIKVKRSHVSQEGYNRSTGGEGPLSTSVKKLVAKKIKFEGLQ